MVQLLGLPTIQNSLFLPAVRLARSMRLLRHTIPESKNMGYTFDARTFLHSEHGRLLCRLL